MKPAIAVLIVLSVVVTACRGRQTIKVAWDVPQERPDHYRLLVDGREIRTFAPPAVDRSCGCLVVEVPVDRGAHAIRLEACNQSNICSTSAEVRTQ
jgi:hypothetical protein